MVPIAITEKTGIYQALGEILVIDRQSSKVAERQKSIERWWCDNALK